MGRLYTTSDIPINAVPNVADLLRIPLNKPVIYLASQVASVDDIGQPVLMNSGSSNSYTINRASSMEKPFPLYTALAVVQIGSGVTSIVAGTGVTINGVSAGAVTFSSVGELAVVWQYAADTWLVFNKTAV